MACVLSFKILSFDWASLFHIDSEYSGAREEARQAAIQAGGVPLLVDLLMENDIYTRAFAAGALMNILIELDAKVWKKLCL